MLDNEPNTTEAAETAATAPAAKRAAKQPAKKATTRKRTTKKSAAAVPAEAEAVSTQSDAESADPAPVKKAAAKRTVKKAAAKRPAKKTAASRDTAQDSLLEADEAAEQPAAPARTAKKTTRKRSTKKAAAPQPDLLTEDTHHTDGPLAAAELPEEQLTDEELAAAEAAIGSSATASGRSATARGRSATASSDSATDTSGATSSTSSSTERGGEAADAPAEGTRRSRRRAPAAAAVLFQAPTEVPAQAQATSPVEATPEEAAPTSRRRRRPSAAERAAEAAAAAAESEAVEPEQTPEVAEEQQTTTRRRRSRRSRDADEAAAAETAVEDDEETDEDQSAEADELDGEEGGEGTRRRRRRRGGRRRRKAGDADSEDSAEEGDESEDDQTEDEADDDQSAESDDETESGTSSRRRRRRRRRKGEDAGTAADDPDETVVRVREPRSKTPTNEITAVEGSTRLEAKKQRRREGRAAGRRRAPIVTEAEFLARRESVERTMVIRAREDLTQIAVSEDNVLVEHYVAQAEQSSLIGNVYLGRVQNVLPSMEAAFIDIGKGRNAVLYAGEVDWATLGGANGPRKIESVLKSGQAVLVQVTKDPIGHKGARLTNQISLPGRYVVYVPRGGNGGISRKLPDTERNRLKGILKDIVPDEAGVIVRTAAEGATEDELTADVSRLQSYWTEIDKKSKNGQAPALLHGEPDLLIRVVRDLFTEDFSKLVISGDDAFDQVKEYVSYVAPHLAARVEKWAGDGDVFSNFRIDEQIKKALDRKVWLPSGGSLIIDRTEAMTVVDVNTGKFTGSGGNLEETVTKNNLEAAEEIVRQLRLRDIGGIIVIDFIDMVLELNRDLVLRRLVECLGRDRTKHQVAEVTSLGLVQMTRKRIGTGLLEAFSENCDHCGGRGLTLHDEPKESRRRQDDGRGRGQQSQQQSQNEQKSDGDSGAAKKTSRSRNRGKNRGRGDDEQPEQEQQNNDAAQRLAQIAAASQVTNGDKGTDEPVQATPEAAETAEATPEQETSAQNGTGRNGSTRRRRSSRSRGAASSKDTDAGNSGEDTGATAPELASTPV
ncbi:Rne/Rng family ribonuclease [Kribbella catacumbae]|uniref:Rne/Rng family ribonuclease n=1 Tax=Kribbella catacumbae TaxID=460086 RepID=UPI00035C4C30|nr:Rne/Rng family ribonuclease [Kribbella catacumbae]